MAMINVSRTLTIEFSARDWQQLEAEARKVNQSKEMVVLHILQERLQPKPIEEALEALRLLSAIGDRQAPFDAEQLIREGRKELAERSIF
jgi:pantothenate kinase